MISKKTYLILVLSLRLENNIFQNHAPYNVIKLNI